VHTRLAAPQTPATQPVSTTVDALVESVEKLLSLPDAAIRLNQLLLDPDVSTGAIAEVVSLDPALAARLLRIVNSAYFGLPGRVDTIAKAVSMIGTSELHSLVLATSAAMAFRRISSRLVDMEAFWQHSVRAALAARGFATTGLRAHRERVFLAGLLHDVGQLVIYQQLPEQATAILEAVRAGYSRDTTELELLGFTHADVGATLLERWNLPASLTQPVRHHHDFEAASDYAREAALLYLGTTVSDLMERDSGEEWARTPDVPPRAWIQAGCTPDGLEEVVVEVSMNWLQVVEIVAPGSVRL
jgi:putative nucleotidyltransferase with HDIG domain